MRAVFQQGPHMDYRGIYNKYSKRQFFSVATSYVAPNIDALL